MTGRALPLLTVGDALRRASNPPRQDALTFRIATQPLFRDWMLAQLRRNPISLPDIQLPNPLLALNLEDPESFIQALLSAWAAVGDNLTFYQERIANEGFLRTATEELSLRALIGSVGSSPRPALSAKTFLAFTLLQAVGGPERLLIPATTAIQSIPLPGEQPVVFETDEDIEARPEWNQIQLRLPEPQLQPPIESGITTQLRVVGTGKAFSPGMPIIAEVADADGCFPIARQLATVEPDPVGNLTLIGWDVPLTLQPGASGMANFQVCTQSAKLFGANAPAWNLLPPATQAQCGTRNGAVYVSTDGGTRWAPQNTGLPPTDVRALAVDGGGMLYAAMGDSIVAEAPDGRWSVLATPSPRNDILSLTIGEDGRLFAGTQRGDVLCTEGSGTVWYGLTGPLGELPPKGKFARLPLVPVLALTVIDRPGSQSLLVAGTATGLWTVPSRGGNWSPWSDGLPGYDTTSWTAAVSVNALIYHPGSKHTIAATDQGLFIARTVGSSWAKATMPQASLAALCLAAGSDGTLFAGVSSGLLLSQDGGRNWHATTPLPGAPGKTGVAQLAVIGKRLYAANSTGFFQSDDRGGSWVAVPSPLADGPIAALGVGGGKIAVAEPFKGIVEQDWPGLVIAPTAGDLTLDLDRAYPAMAPGTWIVLAGTQPAATPEAPPTPFALALPVTAISTIVRRDFQTSGRITRIETRGLRLPIDPRTTTAFLYPRPFDLVPMLRSMPTTLVGGGVVGRIGGALQKIQLVGAIEDLLHRRVSISGLSPRLQIVQQAGGVRHWDGTARTWRLTGTGNHNTNVIMTSPTYGMLLGGQVDIRRFAEGDWQLFGSLGKACFSLAEETDGKILAGTTDGVWRGDGSGAWAPVGLPNKQINALLAEPQRILAGAAGGLYLSSDAGATWTAVPEFLLHEVTTIMVTGTGRVLVGCADGTLLFETTAGWQAPDHPPEAGRISALASTSGAIYAGTLVGIFLSKDEGATWTRQGPPETAFDVRAIAADRTGAVWAAVRGRGVMQDFVALPSGIANDIRTFAFDADGVLHAGSLFSSALLPKNGSLGLELGEPNYVDQISVPGLAALLSNEGPVSEDLRRIFDSHRIALPQDGQVHQVADDCWAIGDDGAATYKIYAMGDDLYRILLETGLAVQSAPRHQPGGLLQWDLVTHTGVEVTLDALPTDVTYATAGTATAATSEVAEVAYAQIADDRLSTNVSFKDTLGNAYDAASVTLCANVASASHGETALMYEVVGSGDNSVANQSFPLRRQPVTALPDSSPQGYRYAIEVRVRNSAPQEAIAVSGQLRPRDMEQDSVRWLQVASLDASKPSDMHFVALADMQGQVTVNFGDGINGKRLPTGTENVSAQYRVGSGAAGNLGVGRLTMPKKRPPGVQKVTNPVVADGGTDGDQFTTMREIGPINARALLRVISQRDLEAFALARPGIAKVRIDERAIAGRPVLLFTIVTVDDAALATGSSTLIAADFDDLHLSLKNSGPRKPQMMFTRYRPRWFNLTATVVLDPTADPGDTLDAARAALGAAFGFKNRTLGASVLEAELVSTLQQVGGIDGVFIEELYLIGCRAGRTPELTAAAGDLADDDTPQPAELLLINDLVWDPLRPDLGGINLRQR